MYVQTDCKRQYKEPNFSNGASTAKPQEQDNTILLKTDARWDISEQKKKMKKLFIYVTTASCLLLMLESMTLTRGTINVRQCENNSTEVTTTSSSSYSIICYKLSTNATARCKGTYDSDANTLTVHGNTYRVRVNPRYGDGTKYGNYYYVAGDYYFDL